MLTSNMVTDTWRFWGLDMWLLLRVGMTKCKQLGFYFWKSCPRVIDWELQKKFRLLNFVSKDDSHGWYGEYSGWGFQAFWIVVDLLDGWKHVNVNGMDGWF